MPYMLFRFAGLRRFGIRMTTANGKVVVNNVRVIIDHELPDITPFANGKPVFGPNVVVQLTSAEMVRRGHVANIQQAMERRKRFPETTFVHPSNLWPSI